MKEVNFGNVNEDCTTPFTCRLIVAVGAIDDLGV
jgi:hypothetical protein